MNCLFCKIAHGEMPSDTVYEDGDVRVFKDIHPKAPTHLLIVPKVHVQSIAHLEEGHRETIAKLIYTAKQVAEDNGLAGYKLVFNVGEGGGQSVDHLHLHILGGWSSKEERSINV